MKLLQKSNIRVILIPIYWEKNRIGQDNNISPKRLRINMTTKNSTVVLGIAQ